KSTLLNLAGAQDDEPRPSCLRPSSFKLTQEPPDCAEWARQRQLQSQRSSDWALRATKSAWASSHVGAPPFIALDTAGEALETVPPAGEVSHRGSLPDLRHY
ncbi:Hypothetical predicted protein, partial [Marmota monax]